MQQKRFHYAVRDSGKNRLYLLDLIPKTHNKNPILPNNDVTTSNSTS